MTTAQLKKQIEIKLWKELDPQTWGEIVALRIKADLIVQEEIEKRQPIKPPHHKAVL
jgi:hypothetical protein